MESIEEITNAIDNKRYATGIFIDLKKAFDTINHDIINKLDQYQYHFKGTGTAFLKQYSALNTTPTGVIYLF